MVKPLKKQAMKRAKKTNPYVVRIGTRRELGPPKTYLTEPTARNAIIAALDDWKPWCTRYNSAGIDALDAAIEQLGNTTFHHEPARIECCFDEHSDMWLAAEFWTTR